MKTLRIIAVAASLAAATTLAPAAVQAHGAIVYNGTTGLLFDAGGSFSRTISRYVGRDRSAVNVQLSGFDLNFRYSDHHIDRTSVRIEAVSYNASNGVVSFRIAGAYYDKNFDDDFYWRGNYTILAID